MRIHEEVVESELAARRGDEINMGGQGSDVLVPDRSRINLQLLIDLESLETLGSLESEVDLLVIEDLQTQDILSLMAESGQRGLYLFGLGQEIGYEDEYRAVGHAPEHLIVQMVLCTSSQLAWACRGASARLFRRADRAQGCLDVQGNTLSHAEGTLYVQQLPSTWKGTSARSNFR